MKPHDVLAAFGANQGNGAETFRKTVALLEREFGKMVVSRLIRTRAVTTGAGVKAGAEVPPEPDYWNAVLRFQVPETWTPCQLLDQFLELEAQMGRNRAETTPHWAARPLDLDLLLWDSLFLDAAPQLVVPHPMMAWRQFVLEPACEIAADWVHPLTGLNLRELLNALAGDSGRPNLKSGSAANSSNQFELWDSMEPIPETLLELARQTHRPILARRWVCRNGEPESVWTQIQTLVRRAYHP